MVARFAMLALASTFSVSAAAQTSGEAPPPAAAEAPAAPAVVVPAVEAAPATRSITLPPNTEIMMTVPESVTSKKMKEGDTIAVRTLFDVMYDGVIVIPKSTFGTAKVTWRTGKGVFGKSAKFEITFESLDLGNGRKLALAGKHRQEGRGNTGATVGVVAAAGLVGGLFVTGRSAEMVPGQQILARTAEAAAFTVPVAAARTETATPASLPTAEPAPPAAAAEAAPKT